MVRDSRAAKLAWAVAQRGGPDHAAHRVFPGRRQFGRAQVQHEVIGIVSQNISTSDKSDRQGFVVTSNTAWQLLIEKPSSWWYRAGNVLRDQLTKLLTLSPRAQKT